MHAKASATSAAINLLNTIIGAGMLAMPYAIMQYGVLLGLAVVLLSALTSSFGLYLQGRCTSYVRPGEASFFALAQLTYPQLSVVFDLAIAVKCLGVGISYLVVIGDLMPQIVQTVASSAYLDKHGWWLLERNLWISISMVLVVVPLSFLKRLDSLKYASMVALSSVFYLVVLVVVHFCKDDIEDRGPVRLFTPRSAAVVFATFPIFVFAYTCHQNMFSLVNELEDKSGRNINRVISYAISVAVSLYILVGVTGYVSFGDTVPPNVIVGYKSSVSSTVGRVAIVVLVMLSYPLQCHPARASINHIIHYFTHVSKLSNTLSSKLSTVFDTLSTLSQRSDTASSSLVQPQQVQPQPPQQVQQVPVQEPVPEPRTDRVLSNEFDVLIEYDELTEEAGQGVAPLIGARFYIITTLILVFSYLVAITVTSLAHVLAFVGSTGSTSISFILPGIFGYQLIGSEYYDEETREYSRDMPKVVQMVRYLALALTVWGFTVMVMCLSATIFLGASE